MLSIFAHFQNFQFPTAYNPVQIFGASFLAGGKSQFSGYSESGRTNLFTISKYDHLYVTVVMTTPPPPFPLKDLNGYEEKSKN